MLGSMRMELVFILMSEFCNIDKEVKLNVIINLMHQFKVHTCMHIGIELVRQRFAVVDISDNYSFNFLPGVSDNDIFPG